MTKAFNSVSFRWNVATPTGNAETTGRFGSRSVQVGHLIFLLGDYYGAETSRLGDVLNTNTETWEALPAQPVLLDASMSLVMHRANLVDDAILVYGVSSSLMGFPDVFKFDLATQELEKVSTYGATVPYLWEHTSEFYEQGRRLLVYGGASKRRPYIFYDRLQVLHVDSLRWEFPVTKGKEPPALYRHSSCIACRRLFIFGGHTQSRYISDIYSIKLSPEMQTYVWEKVKQQGDGPGTMGGTPLAPLADGRIIIYGGRAGARRKLYMLEKCNTASPRFVAMDEESTPYSCSGIFPVAAQCADMIVLAERIIIIGGSTKPPNPCGYHELIAE